MPVREAAVMGMPTWIDLASTDVAAARAFYPAVLGWEAGEANEEFGGYFMFFAGGRPVAGCMPKSPEDPSPVQWLVYLAVPDAEASAARAAANGGLVVAEPMGIPGMGTMSVFVDPDGAVIGVWQPGDFPGFGVTEDPGAPTWFELSARDYAAELAFYSNVFGWDPQVMGDTDDFRYSTVNEGSTQHAGIHDAARILPDGAPATWTVYFRVEDTDAALEAVSGNGGTVVSPAQDTPFGRLGIAADPSGARFTLIGARP